MLFENSNWWIGFQSFFRSVQFDNLPLKTEHIVMYNLLVEYYVYNYKANYGHVSKNKKIN